MPEYLSTESEGLFSDAARGKDGPECRYGGDCEYPTTSTGWIRRHPAGHADREWYAEFCCESGKHPELYSRGGRSNEIITLVLAEQEGSAPSACSCLENVKGILEGPQTSEGPGACLRLRFRPGSMPAMRSLLGRFFRLRRDAPRGSRRRDRREDDRPGGLRRDQGLHARVGQGLRLTAVIRRTAAVPCDVPHSSSAGGGWR